MGGEHSHHCAIPCSPKLCPIHTEKKCLIEPLPLSLSFSLGGGEMSRWGPWKQNWWVIYLGVPRIKPQVTCDKLLNSPSNFPCRGRSSLRIQPSFLIPCLKGHFHRIDICGLATEIPYWWCKIHPGSGQELWLVNEVILLFSCCLLMIDKRRKVTKVKSKGEESTTKQSLFVEHFLL